MTDPERDARVAWTTMSRLVLDNAQRAAVSEAVDLPFTRVRALWRIASSPMTLGELAVALRIDPPNCTPVVDDLERRGLVERRPHPTDRRSKLVVATSAGVRVAKRAQRRWDQPPSVLQKLTRAEVAKLAALLTKIRPSD